MCPNFSVSLVVASRIGWPCCNLWSWASTSIDTRKFWLKPWRPYFCSCWNIWRWITSISLSSCHSTWSLPIASHLYSNSSIRTSWLTSAPKTSTFLMNHFSRGKIVISLTLRLQHRYLGFPSLRHWRPARVDSGEFGNWYQSSLLLAKSVFMRQPTAHP